jgi:membrane fusion protein, multidrug efflux system
MKPKKAQNFNTMKKYILPVLYMAIVTSCSNRSESGDTENKDKPAKKVETIMVSYENAPQTLVLPAELHAFEKANLNARVQGYVQKTTKLTPC